MAGLVRVLVSGSPARSRWQPDNVHCHDAGPTSLLRWMWATDSRAGLHVCAACITSLAAHSVLNPFPPANSHCPTKATAAAVEAQAKMLAQIFTPLYLPVLQLTVLLTTPALAHYTIAGLLASPIIIPALIIKNTLVALIFLPGMLLTLPVAIPVGGLVAAACVGFQVVKSFIVVLTPLLWPLWFLCKWWQMACIVSQVLITDTIMPWLVPLRFTFLAAILPKLTMP